MPQKRIDIILEIIKEKGFVTVKYLCDELHYSTATINRDLNELQKQGLIIRNHGGAESIKRKYAPLVFRIHKNKHIKSKIATEAAKMLSDGMTIFIDGSTTSQYLAKYIQKYNNITVITNNINLAAYLSELRVSVICLGGRITESPYVVSGIEAANQAETYNASIAFFSTSSFTANGTINIGNNNYNLIKAMIKNSKKSVFIADSSKTDFGAPRILCDFSQVSAVITDYNFSDEVKNSFPNTEFIEVDSSES
ncbi:MAG: DeoR/GlpR transcriptional regulator [Oscillospiraceae bacterium]|nr:DeoR/GlpR transcriptional regulator [Oscillospiraceae bacterium]